MERLAQEMGDRQLVVFDVLTKLELRLTKQKRERVRSIAGDLPETLKSEKVVLDWRERQQWRAEVLLTIEETLDRLPQSYTQDLYAQTRTAVYHPVYESYYGEGRSICSVAA